MGHQRIFQHSSLHKVDFLLHLTSATQRRLRSSSVFQYVLSIDHLLQPRSFYRRSCCFAASTLSLGLQSGLLLAVPIPEEHAAAGQQIEEAIRAAVTEARCADAL